MELEVAAWGNTDPSSRCSGSDRSLHGEELGAAEAPLLAPQVTGIFTGSTLSTPPVTVAYQPGACTLESLRPGVSSLVKCVYLMGLSGGQTKGPRHAAIE